MSTSQNSPRPSVTVRGRSLGGGHPFLIAGPCVLETRELAFDMQKPEKTTRPRKKTIGRGI